MGGFLANIVQRPRCCVAVFAFAVTASHAAPAVAQAEHTISWSPDALVFRSDGASWVEIATRSYADTEFPAFHTSSPVSYPEDHCIQDGDWIVCDWATSTVFAGGPGSDDVTVLNSFPSDEAVTLNGGLGNDNLTDKSAGGRHLDGGSGDDKLADLGDGADRLFGGDGDDTLKGGPGDDEVRGGPGNDNVYGDTVYGDTVEATDVVGTDVIDGGPGSDASGGWGDPVSVTVGDGPNDGQPGERDDVIDVERMSIGLGTLVGTDADDVLGGGTDDGGVHISGLGGNDVLDGEDHTDVLDGGDGSDEITGGFDSDTIVGGPGADRIFGDRRSNPCGLYSCPIPYGNDVIHAIDGEVDDIYCGVGSDIANVDRFDVVSDCETVNNPPSAPLITAPTPTPTPTPTLADRRAPAVSVKTPARVSAAALQRNGLAVTARCDEPCVVTAVLRLDGVSARRLGLTRARKLVSIGTARSRLGKVQTKALRLRVKASAAKRLRRLTVRSRLTVVLTAVDMAGNRTSPMTRRVRVVRARVTD